MKDSDFISESHIKIQYKVTNSVIKKFGEPDKTIPNRHCPSGNRRIKLFEIKRIERIMEHPDVREDIDKGRKRSESHKKRS